MEQKNYTEVLIDGRIYTLGGTEEEMYLQKVAAYINEKTGKIKKQEGFSRLSADFQAVMIELNIADDYFKEQERADRLAEQKAALEKEAYSLKHELITTQMKLENIEKELEAEKRKVRKLQRADKVALRAAVPADLDEMEDMAAAADESDPAAVEASQEAAAAETALETDIVSGQEWSTGKGGSGSTPSARRRK